MIGHFFYFNGVVCTHVECTTPPIHFGPILILSNVNYIYIVTFYFIKNYDRTNNYSYRYVCSCFYVQLETLIAHFTHHVYLNKPISFFWYSHTS